MERINGSLGSRFFRLGGGRIEINVRMVRIVGTVAPEVVIYQGAGGYVLYSTRSFGPSFFRLAQPSGEVSGVRFATLLQDQKVLDTLAANGWAVRVEDAKG